MTHKCGWCGQSPRARAQPKTASVSHGICVSCLAEMIQEVFGVGRTEKDERHTLPRHFAAACAAV